MPTSGMPMPAWSAKRRTVSTIQACVGSRESLMICAPVLRLAMNLLISSEMVAPPKPTTSENTSSPPTFSPASSMKRFSPNTLMTMPSTTITARLVITKSRILFMGRKPFVASAQDDGDEPAELKTGRQYCQTVEGL